MIDQSFKAVFGRLPDIKNYTPGRVNLIGEHIDYNGGMVLPTALPIGIETALAPRKDNQVRITSDRFPGVAEFNLEETYTDHWAKYVLGAIKYGVDAGLMSGGADVCVHSTMPDGGGLSSSAALIVSLLKSARTLSNSKISDPEIAIIARRVENDYIGVPCGIMDQMAVAIATEGKGLALDTNTLDYTVLDLPSDIHMAVVHSGVQRKLSEGRYAIRKEECDEAKKLLGRDDICLIDNLELKRSQSFADPINKRTRHCVTEHRRVVQATKAIAKKDIDQFGRLMIQSHISMRDDFEMSVPEIDALVDTAVDVGAIGARLTGGGFGGCIVACVEKAKSDAWRENLLSHHPNAYFIC